MVDTSNSALPDRPPGARSATPLLAELRRVRWADVIIVVLVLAAVWLVLANADEIASVLQEMKGAQWGWVAAAFVVSCMTALTGGLAITGGFTTGVPYRPSVVLQTACWFLQLVSGSVGAVAGIVRFAQKRDLSASTAVSAGLLVSVSGFAVQVLLLVVFFVVASPTLPAAQAGSPSIPGWVLGLVIGISLGAGGALVVPRFRRWIADRVRAPAHDVRQNLATLVRSPVRMVRLFGGALGTNLLLAAALGLSLRAFDQSLPFATLIAINTLTSFVNGLAPVPGGVGVAEATLYAGLTAAGIAPAEAAAVAATYRVAAAYLPQLGGWISLIWLRHHDYL